jgi:hypothetical protein
MHSRLIRPASVTADLLKRQSATCYPGAGQDRQSAPGAEMIEASEMLDRHRLSWHGDVLCGCG